MSDLKIVDVGIYLEIDNSITQFLYQILTGQWTGQYQILPLSTELEEERDAAGERAESVEQEVEVEVEEQEEGEEDLLVLGR